MPLRCDFCTMFVSPKTVVQEELSYGRFAQFDSSSEALVQESVVVLLLCPTCNVGECRIPPRCGGCGRWVAWKYLSVHKVSAMFDPDEYEAEVDCPRCGLMPTAEI